MAHWNSFQEQTHGSICRFEIADGFAARLGGVEPTPRPGARWWCCRDFSGEFPHPRGGRPLCRARLPGRGAATFHRVKPGVELGYTADDMQAGMELKAAVEALPAPA